MILDNYQFNYVWQGNRERPIILFLHGFMGDRHDFDGVIRELFPSFSCLTIDLPGHGSTKVLGEEIYYNMPNTARALIEFLKSNQVEQCFSIGYSLGGRIALYLTLHFPEYFKKVVIESASPGLVTAAERQTRRERDRQLATELVTTDLKDFLEKWYDNLLFASCKQHPNFGQVLQQRLKNDPQELAKSLRNISTGLQPSLWHKLKHNQNSILFLAGEFDQKFININQTIIRFCPNSQLKIIKDSGHNIHFEKPIEYAQIIQEFFRE